MTDKNILLPIHLVKKQIAKSLANMNFFCVDVHVIVHIQSLQITLMDFYCEYDSEYLFFYVIVTKMVKYEQF